jgi:hypothetical protein
VPLGAGNRLGNFIMVYEEKIIKEVRCTGTLPTSSTFHVSIPGYSSTIFILFYFLKKTEVICHHLPSSKLPQGSSVTFLVCDKMLALKPWPLLAIILSCEALNQESGYGIDFKSGYQCVSIQFFE